MSEDLAQDIHPETALFGNKFKAQDYLKKYYPQVTDIQKLLGIASRIRGAYEASDRVDIGEIADETATEHEVLENIAIFDFQRAIAKSISLKFPAGDALILDVGGGPTIYQHIALSLFAGHITHSELVEENRLEVLKWLNEEESAHSWDGYFELMRQILRSDDRFTALLNTHAADPEMRISQKASAVKDILESVSVTHFKRHVREKIANDVVRGDVFRQDLGLPEGTPDLFDIVTSNYVIESATGDRERWEKGMINSMAHVRDEGFFVVTAIRNASWYSVGDEKLPATSVDEKDISAICEKAGFKTVLLRVLEGSNLAEVGYDGMIFMLAQRSA